MKRILLLLSFFLFVLFGCEARTPPEPVVEFSSQATICVKDSLSGNFQLQGKVTCTAQGVLVITVTSPEELKGLCYKWVDGFEMIYNDLHLKTESDYLPDFSFPQVLHDVMGELIKGAQCCEYDGNTAIFEGESSCGEYRVVTDKRGYIQNISVKEISLAIDFIYDDE